MGDLDIYFSYRTAVAFRLPGVGLVVRQNDWGATTGKHLIWIDGGTSKTTDGRRKRAERVSAIEFQRLWDEHVAPLVDAGAVA